MSVRPALVIALLVFAIASRATAAFAFQATPVEPADLARRADLIGHEVVVDDRLTFYVSRTGAEDDEIRLKRTSVPFMVPQRLRPENASRISAVVLRGILEREGSRVICRVIELRPVPNDLERLKQGVASLPPQDYLTRQAWARWAEQRGREFSDGALLQRAKVLDAEALRIQGDVKRVAVDAPREWLAMAQDARTRKVPEPEPSALAHRAFRALLADATDANQFRSLADQIEAFFPTAAADRQSADVNLGRYQVSYASDPAAAYRSASQSIRKALDRRLWADAVAQTLEHEPTQDLAGLVATSEKAAALLPERADLSKRILEKAVAIARDNLGELRLEQVQTVAKLVREKLELPQESAQILSDWLRARRDRLSRTDAEGRILLASQFEDLAHDRASAIELLQQAWKVDPASRELAEAFRSRGFHKEKDRWVETPAPTPSAENTPAVSRIIPGNGQGLRGLTPDQVRTKLGRKPDRISKVGTRGQLILQWMYLDTRQVRFVNLLHAPGELEPRVIADYVLPRNGTTDDFDSAH